MSFNKFGTLSRLDKTLHAHTTTHIEQQEHKKYQVYSRSATKSKSKHVRYFGTRKKIKLKEGGGKDFWEFSFLTKKTYKSIEQRLNLSWSWQQRPLYNLQYPVHLSRLQRIYLPTYLKLSFTVTPIWFFSKQDIPVSYDLAAHKTLYLYSSNIRVAKIVAF